MQHQMPEPADAPSYERDVVEAIAGRRGDLVALTRSLIGFDTQAHAIDDPRDEAPLQEFLADRLRGVGFGVKVWEPAPDSIPPDRLLLGAGFHFRGRPQLVARRAGVGGGRSLIFNGHIDTVTVEPRDLWFSDPFGGGIRDGRLYGRGACDMKGGVAAMVFAAEVLCELGVPLLGELVVNTVTDEESTAAGAVASALAGVCADGCIVTEPTDLQAWLGTRGSLQPTVTVHGRSGHAGLRQPHFIAGGAVNAIEKMQYLLEAVGRLREDWARRHVHPHLDPPDVVPTAISAGEWIVTQPGTCTARFHLQYLPAQADEDGWGSLVEREFDDWLQAAAAADPWLAEHPPVIEWTADVPPSYVEPSAPIAATTLQAATDLGLPGGINPHTTWFDGATLVRHGTPAIAFGPGNIARAHTIDEFVPVDELVAAAQVLALTAIRFCGTT
jgi:acetylornithine deacetylase